MTATEDRKFRKLCQQFFNLSVKERIELGFRLGHISTPHGDRSRSFKTMVEYRDWCDKNLPADLGFKKAIR